MKRFFVAVCFCGLFGLNVSAQEPTQVVGESVLTVAGAADCGCGQTAPAVDYVAAPIEVAPVLVQATPAVNCCCEPERNRLEVVSRVRGGLTSVRSRVSTRVSGLRKNDDCCY